MNKFKQVDDKLIEELKSFGYKNIHDKIQARLVEKAFTL